MGKIAETTNRLSRSTFGILYVVAVVLIVSLLALSVTRSINDDHQESACHQLSGDWVNGRCMNVTP